MTDRYYAEKVRKWWFVLRRLEPNSEALPNPKTGQMIFTEKEAAAYVAELNKKAP